MIKIFSFERMQLKLKTYKNHMHGESLPKENWFVRI